MTDFLLELRSEEIPARMQAKAREDLARLFAEKIAGDGLVAKSIGTFTTPRRLVLIARGLPDETAPTSVETKGPKVGAPQQAIDGFLRRYQLTLVDLEERDGVYFAVRLTPSQPTAAILGEASRRAVFDFAWPKSMRWGDASQSTESLRWVRPLHGIVALFGDQVVPFDIDGIQSGATTLGHRFHHPGPITIGSAADYVEKLRACHVLVDQDERRRIIALGATMAARKAGLDLVEDEGLLIENAGLTEWPAPLLGRFDEAFLDVPSEVIQLTARVNQKYFVCRGKDGELANAFVCTANIDAADGGAKIVDGNRKVLAARLADAKFFYDTDLKTRLEDQLPKLEKIVFHEKLGTVADKVDRVAKLARWLVEEGIILPGTGRGTSEAGGGGEPQATPLVEAPLHHQPAAGGPPPLAGEELAALAERAARLAKADLVTGMVGEFPELQGLMGGYYAAAQGEPAEVAEAIRDHYKPVGQGDEVPTAPVTVAVSLADKLDSISSFFAVGEKPTGSKDPFALRRSALGVIAIILNGSVRLSLFDVFRSLPILSPATDAFEIFEKVYGSGLDAGLSGREAEEMDKLNLERLAKALAGETFSFIIDRLKVQQREAGVRHDLIDAVFALGGEDDLVRLLARVHALQAFVGTEDGANLLTGYRRAANILKKEGWDAAPSPLGGEGRGPLASASGKGEGLSGATDPHPSAASPLPPSPPRGEGLAYTPEPAEAALIAALDAAAPAAAQAVEREDFEAAMAALATLRAPIDAFFEDVTVNDADPAKRTARLALLARIRDAVHGVADFSKIEG